MPNYQVLNNRALVLRRMGLTNEALYNFDKSLWLEEKQAEVYYLRAQTHYETKNYQSALNDVKVAIQLSPDYPEAQKLLQQSLKNFPNLTKENKQQAKLQKKKDDGHIVVNLSIKGAKTNILNYNY